MLGKLCKHELKATARWFLPLFLITLVLAPITHLCLYFYTDIPNYLRFIPTMITFAFICMMIVVAVATVILIIYRFYKSMVTEEGYLTHTLPVAPTTLILSKMLIAAFWSVAGVLVIILALVILFFDPESFAKGWNEIWPAIVSLYQDGISDMYLSAEPIITSGQVWLFTVELFVCLILGVFCNPLVFYASIAIGQLFTRHKVVGSFAGYFIITMAAQVLTTAVIIPLTIEYTSAYMEFTFWHFNQFMVIALILSAASGIIMFFITNFIFKKKLNLD